MAGVWPAGHALCKHERSAIDCFIFDRDWFRKLDYGFVSGSVDNLWWGRW